MSYQLNPIDNPQAWDYVTIAGINSPLLKDGKLDASREYKWDVKEGKGTQGATETFVGQPPVKFSMTFMLFNATDFRVWDQLKALLKYDPTKKNAAAVDIYHPALADLDIHSIVTEKIGAVVHIGAGEYNVTLDLLEYAPSPASSAVSTPDASADADPSAKPIGNATQGGASSWSSGAKSLTNQATGQGGGGSSVF